jgi:glycosyltransferase involved in cell wall biosynthesis
MISNPKVSLIMPCTLEYYETISSGIVVKSASNRDVKLIRAINSFLNDKYPNKELIVVSDGCQKTVDLVNNNFQNYIGKSIHIIKLTKQPKYSGMVRQAGINICSGDIICYLDSDDFILNDHISAVVYGFSDKSIKWTYFNDFINNNNKNLIERNVTPQLGSIGTSSFAHRSNVKLTWQNDYNHDWFTIEKYLIDKPCKKSKGFYVVCHVSSLNIDC